MTKEGKQFRVIDLSKEAYLMPDAYLNGWAKHCGWKATLVFASLCRHADRQKESFPSAKLMAEEFDISKKSVYRGIRTLEEWDIIKKQQRRSKDGRFLHNTYFIMSKEDWKTPPTDSTGKRSPTDSTDNHRRTVSPTKDTHIKETHNNNTSIVTGKACEEPVENSYGKEKINNLLKEVKELLDLDKFADTKRWTRRYAHLCLRDYEDDILDAVKWMKKSWSAKPTKMKTIYYGIRQYLERPAKPYFRGKRMRKKYGKWYVLDRGEWKTFAGSEDDIEWEKG